VKKKCKKERESVRLVVASINAVKRRRLHQKK
jgi:hypothetical protein